MNTLVIVLIAAVTLFGAYMVYGRWLANKWGIDPKAETPAVKYNDGKDYVPTKGWTVFSHQFSSIAGAGPVTGAIRQQHLDGYQFYSGFSSVVYSSEQLQTLVHFMLQLRMKVSQWV